MIDTTIAATEPVAAPEPKTEAAPAIDAAALKAELDALKGELSETRQGMQYWYEQAATRATEARPAPEAAPEPEPEDDTDLLDLITTKGPKGFNAYMRSRGYMSRDEVESVIASQVNQRATQMVTEQQLLQQYPDLSNESSDFFRQTSVNFGNLKRQGVPEHLAMQLAAQQTELNGIKSGRVQTPQQKTDAARAQREADRQARIKAQAGTSSAPRATDDAEDDELTDHEKYICRAMGISEDSYKARAKAGVSMSMRNYSNQGGISTRRNS